MTSEAARAPVRGAAAVVPAAGQARRFGAPKLLAPVGGVPMIERTVRAVLDAGVARVVVVVGPASAVAAAGAARVPALSATRVRLAVNPDPDRGGMLSSVQTGLASLEDESAASGGTPAFAVLVLPADMPFVRPETIARVADAVRTAGVLVSPRFDGRRGHPVGLPAAAARAVRDARAADLAAALVPFKAARLEIDVDDPGIHRDVDRPGDLLHWKP